MRVVGRSWVVSTQIGPDPIENGILTVETRIEKARRLVITCPLERVDEIREAVRIVADDPEACPDGEEFDRIMQVYLRTPV